MRGDRPRQRHHHGGSRRSIRSRRGRRARSAPRKPRQATGMRSASSIAEADRPRRHAWPGTLIACWTALTTCTSSTWPRWSTPGDRRRSPRRLLHGYSSASQRRTEPSHVADLPASPAGVSARGWATDSEWLRGSVLASSSCGDLPLIAWAPRRRSQGATVFLRPLRVVGAPVDEWSLSPALCGACRCCATRPRPCSTRRAAPRRPDVATLSLGGYARLQRRRDLAITVRGLAVPPKTGRAMSSRVAP